MRYVVLLTALLTMAASASCAPSQRTNGESPPTAPLPTISAVPTVTPTVAPAIPTVSFVPATYKDEVNGFELDYPSDWSMSPNTRIGSRGSQAGLYSPDASAETLPPGATRVGITIYQWDPKRDLTAFATHRKEAWSAGGSTIQAEHAGDSADGAKELDFIVAAPDGVQAFFLLTTLGDQYLEISGEGDLALIGEIARSLRPLSVTP